MKNRVALIVLLFTMASASIWNCEKPVRYMVEKDEVIEWQCYGEVKINKI